MQSLIDKGYLTEEDFILDPSLVLYLPLHMLDGSPFMSRDHYGSLCTVFGALWTPQGRSYCAAADDYVDCGSPAILDNINTLTVMVWVYAQTLPALGTRIWYKTHKDLQTLANGSIRFQQSFLNGGANYPKWTTAGGTIITSRWYHIGLTYNDGATTNDAVIYVDSVLKSLTESAPPVGTRISDAANNLYIGNTEYTNRGFHGFIGEVFTYNRFLTPIEIQRNYLATKWRYM